MNSTRFYWCGFLTQQPEEQLAECAGFSLCHLPRRADEFMQLVSLKYLKQPR
jgi:hypothetical protein